MEWNAQNYQPAQGGGNVPGPGMHDFVVSDTSVTWNNAKDGMMLNVGFSTPSGRIVNRYNLWNKSPQAVEISNKELSALAHAVGIFRLQFNLDPNNTPIIEAPQAAQLIGGKGRIEVGPQQGKPEYMEVKRVFDTQGNDPATAKPAQQAQQPAPQQQPQGQPTIQNGWGSGAPQTAAAPSQSAPSGSAAPGGWGTQAPPHQQQQPAPGGTQAPPWSR